MNRTAAHIITEVEDVWLEKAVRYLDKHFKNLFLPSHDLYHHLRVWEIAKSMLHVVSLKNENIDRNTVEAVMLASLFHDAGMVVTREPSHGVEGLDVYNNFIISTGEKKPVFDQDIMKAIEFHDNKEEYFYQPFTHSDSPDVATIISIADDMDAIGPIGIYRFTEIYLWRGIPLKKLGIRVIENVTSRYNNFIKATSLFPTLVEHSNDKYTEIVSFFDLYNQQILLEPIPAEVFSGPIGVVNYIRNFSLEGKIRPEKFMEVVPRYEAGKFVLDYFRKLEKNFNDKII